MIVRIVKMSFKEDEIVNFLIVFKKQKEFISSFEGCTHLDLLRDKNNSNIFFTYSYWKDEKYLAIYKQSDFFKNIWSKVKLMFNEKPMAWSLEKV